MSVFHVYHVALHIILILVLYCFVLDSPKCLCGMIALLTVLNWLPPSFPLLLFKSPQLHLPVCRRQELLPRVSFPSHLPPPCPLPLLCALLASASSPLCPLCETLKTLRPPSDHSDLSDDSDPSDDSDLFCRLHTSALNFSIKRVQCKLACKLPSVRKVSEANVRKGDEVNALGIEFPLTIPNS